MRKTGTAFKSEEQYYSTSHTNDIDMLITYRCLNEDTTSYNIGLIEKSQS